MNRLLVFLALITFISACSDPQIDISSRETTQASLEQVRNSLKYDVHRKLFDESWKGLTSKDLSLQDLDEGEGTAVNTSLDNVNAKTAEEIIAAWGIEVQKMIVCIEAEVAALEAEKVRADEKIKDLNKVKVKVLEAVVNKSPLASPVTIKLSITNNTEAALKSVVMHGILKGMGNKRPWQEDKAIYCSPAGGIKPQAQVKCDAYPKNVRTWLQYIHRPDMTIIMTVSQINLFDGSNVDRASGFGTANKTKLHANKQKIAALQEKWAQWLPAPALE